MAPRSRRDDDTTPERASGGRQRLPAPERRERVLDSALELFARDGYAASMGDVARAAGVTRTGLYNYYPSKEQLFLAVLETQASELLRHLAPAVTSEGSQAVRARRVVDAMMAYAQERPRSWALLFAHGRDDGEPAVARARIRVHEMVLGAAAVLLASDMAAAGLGANTVRSAIMGEGALGAAVAVTRWWQDHPEVPRETVTQAVYDLLWLGAEGLPADGRGQTRRP